MFCLDAIRSIGRSREFATAALVTAALAVGCASKKVCTDGSCCPPKGEKTPAAAAAASSPAAISTPVTASTPATAPAAVVATPVALVPLITPADVKGLLDEKADVVLIDCRTPEEVAGGKIEGSTNIPLQEIDQREAELAAFKGKPIIVYCRSGNRSAKFASALKQKGFADVRSMAGGITRWNQEIVPAKQ